MERQRQALPWAQDHAVAELAALNTLVTANSRSSCHQSFRGRTRALVAHDRGEQRAVLLGGGDEAAVGINRVQVVQAGLVAQPGDGSDEPAFAPRRQQGQVEVAVGSQVASQVADRCSGIRATSRRDPSD